MTSFASGKIRAKVARNSHVQSPCFELEVPWLSTAYIEPQVTVADDVKIGFYVTDWWQSEYRLGNDTLRFTVRLRIWNKSESRKTAKKWYHKSIPAGDHVFNIGKMAEGEYIAELMVVDQYGRKGPSLFHEFRVLKSFEIPEKETYVMTEEDLKKYEISNKGDVGEIRFIDATGLNQNDTEARVRDASLDVKAPSGKYVVIVGGEKYDPKENKNHRGARNVQEPEWLPNPWSWRTCKVIYADDYNKEEVEKTALNTGLGINKFLDDARQKGFRKVVFLKGTYRISNVTTIEVPSGMTIDLNGSVIKMNQFAGCHGVQIRMRDCTDSRVVNGIVEGDYFEHDYENSEKKAEWVMGICIDGESKYCGFERILLRYITGYGGGNGFHGYHGKNTGVGKFVKGTIDEKTGEVIPDVEGLIVSEPKKIDSFVEDGGYVTCSRFLGYQGRIGDDWSLRFHFYDKDGKYLETIRGRQYRIVRIPEGAETVRVTVYTTDMETAKALVLNCFKRPWNSWFQDIFILSARCVGLAPSAMFNFRFENCSFVRSGENLAKCAFDAEDGWDMMQDVWIVRNKFLKNPVNELLTCAGHNFIIEDNEASIHLWNRTNGYVIKGNEFRRAFFGAGETRGRTGLIRICNNTYSQSVRLGDNDGEAVDPSLAAVDPSQWVQDSGKNDDKKKRPYYTNWFVTMKDFENANFSLGNTAMISGVNLKGKELTRMSLAHSTLEDCEFKHHFSDSKFFKTIFKNVNGRINHGTSLSIVSSELENCSIGVQGSSKDKSGSFSIKDCKLKEVTSPVGYWNLPQNFTYENCTFENTEKPIIRIGVYSIGEIIFRNCTFNTATAPIVEVYDMRQNNNGRGGEYETLEGKIRFENCKFAKGLKNLIKVGGIPNDGRTEKPITVSLVDSRYAGKLLDKEVDWWTLENPTDKGNRKVKANKAKAGKKNRDNKKTQK